MQLFLKGLDGHCSVLFVEATDSVAALKSRVQAAQGVPICEQLLSANGRILQDSQTLAVSGLQADSTVHVLLRLCGGKGGFGALLRGQGRDGKITDNFDACRDLSGRRIRHVEAEKKLKEWEKDSKERELEQVAMKHMKEMAKQAKRQRDIEVNVEEVKREHKKAADAVVEAVQTALAEGLQHAGVATAGARARKSAGAAAGSDAAVAGPGSDADTSTDGGQDAAAAAAAGGCSPSSKCNGSAQVAQGAAVKKRRTMLDMVEGDESDESDSDDE